MGTRPTILRRRDEQAWRELQLMKDQGTFVPVAPEEVPERSFGDRLFGRGLPPNYYDVGGSVYKLERFPELGEENARSLGLTTPVTEYYEPRSCTSTLRIID